MDLQKESSVWSFHDFGMVTPPACFHPGGKYCLRRTALNTFVRKVVARLGRCLRTLFVTTFGPGELRTLSLLMIFRTSDGVINVGSLAGAHSYARIAS
jgi:hypothetical protein